ncbi:hypothetical protein DSECCO2_573970 [anaerobic digester metagenome]
MINSLSREGNEEIISTAAIRCSISSRVTGMLTPDILERVSAFKFSSFSVSTVFSSKTSISSSSAGSMGSGRVDLQGLSDTGFTSL